MSNSTDDPNPIPSSENELSRRELLKRAGMVLGAAMIPALPLPTQENELKTLTRLEYDTLDAICSRIIPSDETGPGAKEARAVRYIDWGLSGFLNNTGNTRSQYAAALAAVEAHAVSTKGMPFAKLAAADQDVIVTALQNSQVPNAPMGFFNTIRTHTIEGTFGDPYYGGNFNCAGWDLIHYPGVRTTVPAEYQQWSVELKPNHQSAYASDMFNKGVI